MGKGAGRRAETASERRPGAHPSSHGCYDGTRCPKVTRRRTQSQDSTLGQFYHFFGQSLNMGANLSPRWQRHATEDFSWSSGEDSAFNARDVGLVSACGS